MNINQDQVKGRVEEATGAIKETAGKIIGNPTLQVKGNLEKNLGTVRAKLGDVEADLAKPAK
jgi:uncharacterized protein YjbJ (UPF0337 family)